MTSYGRLARTIGRRGAARAVGGAVGRNPIGLAIPCHRVIAGDGSIGGYGGDWFGSREELLAIKRELLAREGVDAARAAAPRLTRPAGSGRPATPGRVRRARVRARRFGTLRASRAGTNDAARAGRSTAREGSNSVTDAATATADAARRRPARPSPFSVFRKRDFRLLWSAQLVSTIGTALTDLAAGILIFRETQSAAAVGLMFVATAVPTLVVGLIAGVFVDRYDRRKIMVIADLMRAAIVALDPVHLHPPPADRPALRGRRGGQHDLAVLQPGQ